MMNIIADENIARVEVFKTLGDLKLLPGREINQETIKNADALLIRSVTKVNDDLLKNSTLKFVASATSGFDHVDKACLKRRNISFHYAPACNARSVVEYVFSALAYLSKKHNFDWRKRTFGIIGAGNIGGLLAKYLRAMDINYLIFDPFLNSDSEHGKSLTSFDKVLQQDILSIHTPLTFNTEFPSYHLFDKKCISALAPGKILINAARGSVIDNLALKERLEADKDMLCVLDAWEGEPEIDQNLLRRVELGTPHIAGYSIDGKLKGTEMIYQALCQFFSIEQPENNVLFNVDGSKRRDAKIANKLTDISQLNNSLLSAYKIKQDHDAMLSLLNSQQPALEFDLLRKHYPVRVEYSAGENLPVY